MKHEHQVPSDGPAFPGEVPSPAAPIAPPHEKRSRHAGPLAGHAYSPTVMRWRRLQIVAVVVGVNMGLVWLLALAWRVLWLAYAAAAVILLAWITILVLGTLTMIASRRPQQPEQL